MTEQLYRQVPCGLCEHSGRIVTANSRRVCPRCRGTGLDYEPVPEPDIERLAAAVHQAYIETCDRLGWSILPANRVPYAALTEASKELDRASVRAVLAGAIEEGERL